jgi:predicted homoserine dehydrogenase-like protein
MKRLVVMGVAAAAMMGATLAHAADATGAIKTISVPDRTVTLEDGKKYTLTGAVDLTKFKVGDKVKITYIEANPVFVSSTGINGSGSAMVPAS